MDPTPSHRQWKKAAVAIVVVAVGLGLVFGLSSRSSKKKADLKERLNGTWRTSVARYKDAYFEIHDRQIIFHTVENTVSVNAITDISQYSKRGIDWVEIEYVSLDDLEFILSFRLLPQPEGEVIIFKNQPDIIWRKQHSEAAGTGV